MMYGTNCELRNASPWLPCLTKTAPVQPVRISCQAGACWWRSVIMRLSQSKMRAGERAPAGGARRAHAAGEVLPAVHGGQLQEGPAGADVPRDPALQPGLRGAAAQEAGHRRPGVPCSHWVSRRLHAPRAASHSAPFPWPSSSYVPCKHVAHFIWLSEQPGATLPQ